MKKLFMVLVFTLPFINAIAQEEDEEKTGGFKKENLFTGGSLNLAFSSYYTAIGLSPYFGYSLNKYLDLAVSANWNYSSQRDVYVPGDKVKVNIFGPGAFVRVFPIHFLFAQAQFEYNFLYRKYVPDPNNIYPWESQSLRASSLLVGGGYSSGRQQNGNTYYYFSVMWDVAGNINSPYVDYLGRGIPIFRAGFNIALFQGNKRGDY